VYHQPNFPHFLSLPETARPSAKVARFFLVQHTKTGKIVPNDHKLYEMVTKQTKWRYDRPNGHKIYQHFSLQDLPKFAQIGIFGLKIYHLATLALACKAPIFKHSDPINLELIPRL
jgi:hypothetical protein